MRQFLSLLFAILFIVAIILVGRAVYGVFREAQAQEADDGLDKPVVYLVDFEDEEERALALLSAERGGATLQGIRRALAEQGLGYRVWMDRQGDIYIQR